MNDLNVFLFKGIENLYSDSKGNFFLNNYPIKKRWRTGQIFIEINKKRYGMNTLKKLAYKSTIKLNDCPF